MIGEGSYYNKIVGFNKSGLSVDGIGFIGYILLKVLLGRLLISPYIFDLKWAYRENYPLLYATTLNSIYKNVIPILSANIGYENLLKWSE